MDDFEELRLIESIVESSPVIIFRWIISEGWPVEYVSKNVSQLGYTQQDLLAGAVSWPGITHPDDEARLEREVKGFLESGQDSWSQTYRIRMRDGAYRWMRDWNLLLRDQNDAPHRIQGIIIDITKEKSAEQQREDAQHQLAGAMARVISGFLPICAKCKAIRNEDGSWTPIERYIAEKSAVQFSHGYCPSCARLFFDDPE